MSKYQSPQAIKNALKGRIAFEQFVRERFLVRVFEREAESEWILKGGMSMILRVPNARATRDLDFSFRGTSDLKAAIDELVALAKKPGEDLLEFDLVDQSPMRRGEGHHGRPGTRLRFLPRFAGTPDNLLSIDLVLGPNLMVGEPEFGQPLFGEQLGLVSTRPLLFPIVDQIAEKACALHEVYAGTQSTRSKDFFDIALLALKAEIGRSDLENALLFESERRSLELREFLNDSPHRSTYLALAQTRPELPQRFDDAVELVNRFLFSGLSDRSRESWNPSTGNWV